MDGEYTNALEAVRQLRAWGATQISVGEISATFPPEPAEAFDLASLLGQDEAAEVEEEATGRDAARAWAHEQYYSAGGR